MTTRTARAKAAAGIHDPRYPAHVRLTPDKLHARAVARRDQQYGLLRAAKALGVSRHELVRLMDTRAPHASRSTPERRHGQRDREAARKLYREGIENNAKGLTADGKKYLRSGLPVLRINQEAAALPMAA